MHLHCQRCGKGVMWGHNVSHAKNRITKIWKPNLQVAHVMVDAPLRQGFEGRGIRQRVMLCTRCVKVLNKMKPHFAPADAKAKAGGKASPSAKASGDKSRGEEVVASVPVEPVKEEKPKKEKAKKKKTAKPKAKKVMG